MPYEKPYLSSRELEPGSDRELLMNVLYPSLYEKVPLDKENFRQYINALQEAFSGLTRESIADLANMKRIRLKNLLSNGYCKYIYPKEITALCQIYWDLMSGKLDSKRKILFDKSNLCQYIDSLQQTFPGLTRKTIAGLANMQYFRLEALLLNKKRKHILPSEITALFQIYEDLESGKATYEPGKRMGKKLKAVRLDKDNLHQYINFLESEFSGLSDRTISILAGFHPGYISQLLNVDRIKNISPEEITALSQVYWDLKSGKLDSKMISIRGKILLDKSNIRQYIDFLQQTFPGLIQETIAELANMQRIRLSILLSNRDSKYIRPEEITALFQVYEDLESGKAEYVPYQRGKRRKKKLA